MLRYETLVSWLLKGRGCLLSMTPRITGRAFLDPLCFMLKDGSVSIISDTKLEWQNMSAFDLDFVIYSQTQVLPVTL